jgi:hypothetical protein
VAGCGIVVVVRCPELLLLWLQDNPDAWDEETKGKRSVLAYFPGKRFQILAPVCIVFF